MLQAVLLQAVLLPAALVPLQARDTDDVSTRQRASSTAAAARMHDADTALQLSSEGSLLYQQEEVKLDGYQYCSQAIALAEAGEFRASVRAASKALHLGEQTGNSDLIAKANRDLAIAYSYSGNLDKAEEFARKALQHEARDPAMVVGPAYKIIGDVQQRRGDYADAVRSYETAAAGSSERYRPLVQTSLVNALIHAGDVGRARAQFDAMPAPEDPGLRNQFQRTGAALLLAEGRPGEARDRYLALVADSSGSDAAYQRMWALEGLARSELALDDPEAAARALGLAIDSLDEVRARFRSEEFKMGLFSDVQRIFEDAVDLNSRLGHPQRAFAYSERSRARALLDEVRDRGTLSTQATDLVDLAALQAMLQADERVVEFHALDDRLLAWVVSPDGIREVAYPLPRASLDALVEAFRDSIVAGRRSAVDGAAQVGDALIAPLALEPGTRLIIVPHGPLHYLPFQALRPNGDYLIRQHPVSVTPSISIAVQLVARGSQVDPRLIAFGNPDVAPDMALPASEDEVRKLAALFPQSTTYLNAAATKSRFRASAGSARLLHVAAHAEADRVDPLYSRILLANENGRQNFLEAHEVLALDLDDVALVTLSACESGLGRVASGDEVLGFSRAFLSAGSSSLILSLWPVADDATEILMTTLYGELARGTDLQTAMQHAQLALLDRPEFEHPFFWAPFNVIGNWRLHTRG
ncbi:CHAT domain-containing protein [Luteimonas sp. BDR2-5]|uniref:CHAT domain-containing protein n=1 Tax=Proluteimonas luteida TaxID=2878685 RepID=UPI001E312F2B|nr:CHAT domain-containing protein [Luteimonas sp. BDR2-5]MCD9027919.1 CHAT domain-containing protein [Luteimonas sp. BDR2-5]